MKIYNYDKHTKVFTEVSEAKVSPLEPGVFLIPANSTTHAPLPTSDGYVNVFKDGAWFELIDKRGVEFYDASGTSYTIVDVGVDVPENCSLTPPKPTPEDIAKEAAEAERVSEIVAAQDVGGFKAVSVLVAQDYINTQFDTAVIDSLAAPISQAKTLDELSSTTLAAFVELRNMMVRAKETHLAEIPYLLK